MLRAQTHGGLFLHKHRQKHPWQKTPPGDRLTTIYLLVRHSNAIRAPRLDLASQPLPNTFFSSASWTALQLVFTVTLPNSEAAIRDMDGYLPLSSSTYRIILALAYMCMRCI